MTLLEAMLLAVTAFASTNIDDTFVLLAFFGDPRFKGSHVIIGQYAGMAALTIAAIAFALLAFAIPDREIGWMGLLPILIGIMRARKIWRERNGIEAEKKVKLGSLGGIITVATVTIANGGDNIAVYVPLFAKTSVFITLAICAVFAAMVAVWCLVARYLIHHRALGAFIQKWGRRLTPFILMALGAYILIRSDALAALQV